MKSGQNPGPAKSHAELLQNLPGLNTPARIKAEILRVNHAGEFGAVQIYRGQIAPIKELKNKATEQAELQHMAEQEQAHLAAFERLLPQRGVRPSLLSPLWKRGGFALGAVTRLLGYKTAMVCTEAVETVIDKHYSEQIDYFDDSEKELKALTEKFRAEELEHRDIARENGAKDAPFYAISHFMIDMLCKLSVVAAKKI